VFLPELRERKPVLIAVVGLAVLSWLSLLLWERSPHARFLSHHQIDAGGGAFDMEYAGIALLFVAAWTLMTVAMMLPSALPLVALFHDLIVQRRDSVALMVCLVAGYLSLWVAFGALVHLGDLGLHVAVRQSHWLEERAWALGGLTLLLAGGYQFTPMKYFCLEKCRSPYSFIAGHWHGRRPILEATHLGVDHAVFCIGCCWSLMLLMFVVGLGNLGWMLALATAMAIEKTMPWGRRLSRPLGLALIVAGATMMALDSAGLACAHDGASC
jgi:predicted metal-binding membrane protein